MRILQINKYGYPKGGADKYFLNVSAALKKEGHQVYKFSMDEPKKQHRSLFWSWSSDKTLKNIIKEFKPDVAHLHNIYHDFSSSILYVLKKHGVPSVMTLHDYKRICPNYRLYTKDAVCERCKYKKYINCFTHKCLKDSYILSLGGSCEAYLHQSILNSWDKNIDLYISPSKFLKNKFKEWDVKKDIEYLPNFVETKKTDVKRDNYLLYFGRIEKEKGIEVLLDAMEQLPNERLVIAGKGSYQVKDTDNVRYVGFVKNVDELVSKAKLVIIPSLWYENNPLNALEAIALGTPILASDIGGIPELTDNLFKPGDATDLANKILNYKDKGGKQHISKEDHIEKLIKIYNKLTK
ncbi:glycosyltransferase [Patescibacteria group bacterium]|nr:glycosyltransferase [Patescibacteria group bacterium]MBU1673285.1 glycosyltransferase [Patescibacteria group bacterium]MBU1963338.1 glycosyltransferase [Patescibacteria group bacterium]